MRDQAPMAVTAGTATVAMRKCNIGMCFPLPGTDCPVSSGVTLPLRQVVALYICPTCGAPTGGTLFA